MNDTITVDQAISRGANIITRPMAAIFIGMVALPWLLHKYYSLPEWFAAFGLLGGAVLAFVYWCYMVTKWKIWAYERVQNVHELKQKAITANLLFNDHSPFAKMAIESASDKAKLAVLQGKFAQKDVYGDDILVPVETIIYISKGAALALLYIMLCATGLGIYLLITKSYLAGIIITIGAGYYAYTGYKESKDRSPKIILNADGIQTSSTPFHSWKQINGEQVITVRTGSGRSSNINYFLSYKYPGGEEQYDIGELGIGITELEHLLQTYRARSEKKDIRG